jgi:predicted alpha/beta-fold hydrolase
MLPFDPLFRNPHLQTIAANFWKRPESSHPIDRRLYQTEPNVQVSVWTQSSAGSLPVIRDLAAGSFLPANAANRAGSSPSRGDVVLVHGLEGSAEAPYMRSFATAALRSGYTAHRFNMRTCGGTEHLCQTLYHAGLTSDLLAVLREFRRQGRPPAFLVGFSLGGNVVAKLAGELGHDAGDLIRGICAVSSPIDLAASARRIAHPDNRLYELRFVRRMRARISATGRYTEIDLARLRSIAAIDDSITAPSFGFGDAANYYRTQSAIRYLPEIRLPALFLQSRDDTLVPFEIFERPEVRSNPCIELLATECGGHVGFLGRTPHRFWADEVIMDWIGNITAGLITRPTNRRVSE